METTAIAQVSDLPIGSMKMVRVDGHRVCLVHTSSGIHAIDNACPHEGYGLTQGGLDGELLTCQWHNWKFRVSDGACVLGEENVRVHDVEIDDHGGIHLALRRPDPSELADQLTASLRRGIEKNYVGQISRDVVRLLRADADPADLMWEAIDHGAPRGDKGWGHSIAAATDCLAMVELYDGDERALPIVQGIANIAETERTRPVQPLADPAPGDATAHRFREAVENESREDAQAILRGAIERGDSAEEIRPWFATIVSDHHLGYGHAAIYTHKAFELLEMIGWRRADTVLPHLVTSILEMAREDTLPYMKPFMRELAHVDLDELSASDVDAAWTDDGRLGTALLGADRSAPVAATVDALRQGAGIDGILDVVVDATSERMLRYDTSGEFDFDDDFGWLDITHGLTYANAVRWLHDADTAGATRRDLLRLTFFTAFLANWTGRHEWHTTVGPTAIVDEFAADVADYGVELQRQALLDHTTAPIVQMHAIKTSRAAAHEAMRRDTALPLDATARFFAGPRLERFVAATVHRSIEFISGRAPRD